MKLCTNWAVTVVYLLEKGAGDLEDIKDYIIEKNISKLSGKDPVKTLRSTLQNTPIDGNDVFRQDDPKDNPNCYTLWDEEIIKEHSEVKRVYDKLEWKENIKILKEHIDLVEQEISRVKQLCDEIL